MKDPKRSRHPDCKTDEPDQRRSKVMAAPSRDEAREDCDTVCRKTHQVPYPEDPGRSGDHSRLHGA
ncbi:hypothetical protein RN2511_045220 [Rhodococcus sp. NKCM2511]|nr:hypothetical protein RN2511_045220 [Rhodococcus sp. NKCM2511]